MDDWTSTTTTGRPIYREPIHYQEPRDIAYYSGATGVEASIWIIAFATIVAMVTAQMDRHGYMRATNGSTGIEVSLFTLFVGVVLTFIQYAKA